MHIEISQAVEFFGRLLQTKLDADVVNRFKQSLTELLKVRFQDHWDPQQPYKGNAYRALSNFNGQLDPILTTACMNANIQPIAIYNHLPRDFVLWVDPYSVSYRVGDHGNIMTLFEGKVLEKSTLIKSSSNSPMLSFIQPRISTPIRISPPNSPESVNKNTTTITITKVNKDIMVN